jgi:hypothetical protein
MKRTSGRMMRSGSAAISYASQRYRALPLHACACAREERERERGILTNAWHQSVDQECDRQGQHCLPSALRC